MKLIKACLSAYVTAWWMKLIALAAVALSGLLLYIAHPARRAVPAWLTPTLVEWSRIPEVVRAANRPLGEGAQNDPVALEDVAALDLDALVATTFDVNEARNLRHVRITLEPRRLNDVEQADLTKRASRLIEFLATIPTLQSIEFSGFVPVESLEPLRGSERIRSLFTGELLINGGKPIAEEQAKLLVDIAASMPDLETWAVPRYSWYLFQRELVEPIRKHPTLKTVLSNPGSPMMMDAMRTAFPTKSVEAGYILSDRIGSAWIGWAMTVVIANLVVLQLADQLLVSSAPVVPRYFATHRLATLICLVVIAAVGTIGLAKASVGFLPAMLISIIAVLIPAALLEYDRRRPVAGTLQLPACLAPALVMLIGLPSFFEHQLIMNLGHRWLRLDRFLAGDLSAMTALLLTAICVGLFVTYWRSVKVYGSSLAAQGRESALSNSAADMGKLWGRLGDAGDNKLGFRKQGVIASKALQNNTLSSPATAKGRRALIHEGLMCIPIKQILLGIVVFCVTFPLFSGMATELRREPWAMPKVTATVCVLMLWFRPVIYWNERHRRIPIEIATLMPRRQYLNAVRSLLFRYLILPAVLTGTAASAAIVMKTGQWWYIPIALLIPLAFSVTIVSMIELAFTFESLLAKSLVCFGVGYAILLCVASVFVTIMHQQGYWIVAAFALASAATGGVYWWATRRIRNFEFGRMA